MDATAAVPFPAEEGEEADSEEEEEWEEEEVLEPAGDGALVAAEPTNRLIRGKKKKKKVKSDAAEIRLQGRRAICKGIADIAPDMLRMVKLRILNHGHCLAPPPVATAPGTA